LAVVYAAFENPGDPIWNKEQRSYIRTLNLFGVTTWYSLMLIAKQKFNDEEFTKLLHELNVITFRYTVISGLHTNEIEIIFNRLSIKIYNNKVTSAAQSFQELKSIYVDDENFEQAFSTKSINTKRHKNLVKYILIELENSLSGTDHQFEDATSTIEHILSENSPAAWDNAYSLTSAYDYIYLLGNLTLLEDSLNKKAGDKTFLLKKEFYKISKYKISRDELNYSDWTPITLRNHQDKMARWACNAWKSNYFTNKEIELK